MFETSKPTTHDEPTFLVDNVVHYCVTNMPGAVPLTASLALNKATLPYIKLLANLGIEDALNQNPGLQNGLNISKGEIKHQAVSEALSELNNLLYCYPCIRYCSLDVTTEVQSPIIETLKLFF